MIRSIDVVPGPGLNARPEEKSVQVRVLPRRTVEGHPPGTVYYVTPSRARLLMDQQAIEIIGMPRAGERAPIGPAETKESDAKKVFGRTDEFPFNRFSFIRPVWKGATVVCVGGGPSIRNPEDFAAVTAWRAGGALENGIEPAPRRRVIAINNSYLPLPCADVVYFADALWHEWHCDRTEFKAHAGEKCSIEQTGEQIADANVHILRNDSKDDGFKGGLSKRPDAIKSGGNSGYQALGVAIAAGAARIILLGYDMRFIDGKSHWHGGHKTRVGEGNYSRLYTRAFRELPGNLPFEIWNATPGSLLTNFPAKTLAECLS